MRVRAALTRWDERMKTQSISHLLYYPITFYARSSPSNSYLSSPRSATFHSIPSSQRETTATRITISGERVERREGHRGDDKKGLARGS